CCPNINAWQPENASQVAEMSTYLSYDLDKGHKVVRLTMREEFLSVFYRPENLAEREVVKTIIRAGAEMAGATLLPEDEEDLVAQILKNQDSRFFHVLLSSSLESVLYGP